MLISVRHRRAHQGTAWGTVLAVALLPVAAGSITAAAQAAVGPDRPVTDTRRAVGGDDPRYDGGEGFDVLQCRTADASGVFGPDTCPNAGALDQDIFGTVYSH
jgi:hypothetical protein